jgi:hypothetical protein
MHIDLLGIGKACGSAPIVEHAGQENNWRDASVTCMLLTAG